MATPRIPPAPNPLWIALAHAIKETALLRRALVRLEERTYFLEQYLRDQVANAPASAGAPPPPLALSSPKRSRPGDSRFLLELEAQRGVANLEFSPLPNGFASVRIENGPAFALSPKLFILLDILATDPGHDDGELVGWKSREEVIEQMQKRSGEAFTVHAIQQLVSRLRKVLARDAQTNPYLVQSNLKSGWRFALRRKTAL